MKKDNEEKRDKIKIGKRRNKLVSISFTKCMMTGKEKSGSTCLKRKRKEDKKNSIKLKLKSV